MHNFLLRRWSWSFIILLALASIKPAQASSLTPNINIINPCDFACQPAPVFAFSADSFAITGERGGSTKRYALLIRSASNETVSWSADTSVDWLTLSASGGVTPAEVEVRLVLTDLDLGTYTGAIEVSVEDAAAADVEQGGLTWTIPVTVTVTRDTLYMPLTSGEAQ